VESDFFIRVYALDLGCFNLEEMACLKNVIYIGLCFCALQRQTRPAMSNPRAACGPLEGFVRPSLGCRCSKSILYSDNLFLFWWSWISHFWCRWSWAPLYHVCYHCS